MSEAPLGRLDFDEQVARIERMQAETRKFGEESRKLGEEAMKLNVEILKLYAEGMKFERERTTLVLTAGAALAGAAAVVGGLVVRFLH
jgi:hypothetical protein